MADLVTLEEYKIAIGISSNKDDAILGIHIPAVSALIKTYCGRTFVDYVSSAKIEIFNPNAGVSLLVLDESPVISITSVEERASYDSLYAILTEGNQEYYHDSYLDTLHRTSTSGTYIPWATGPGAVKVTYLAGYTVVPADLQLAAFDLITYYVKNEYRTNKVLSGASINTPGTGSQAGNVSFPDHIKRVLDLHRNI